MYDMYSRGQPASQADDDAEATPAPGAARRPAKATLAASADGAHAVQVALDRRDNGGDADPGRPA